MQIIVLILTFISKILLINIVLLILLVLLYCRKSLFLLSLTSKRKIDS